MPFWTSEAQIGPLTFRGNVVSSLLHPSCFRCETYIAPVSLISVILSVIQALLQCHHKCVFNVINDLPVGRASGCDLAAAEEREERRSEWWARGQTTNLKTSVIKSAGRRGSNLTVSAWTKISGCLDRRPHALLIWDATRSASLILLLADEWHQKSFFFFLQKQTLIRWLLSPNQ